MWIGSIVELLRNLDRLLRLETNQAKTIEGQATEVRMFGERVARLEAREDLLIAEAKAADAAAATQVSIASVSDIAHRIGRLEERSERGRLAALEQSKPTDR